MIKKLTLIAALLFTIYVGITAAVIYPLWPELSATEAFSVIKHIGVLLALIVYLIIQPKIGSWFIAAWGVFVPLEKYLLLGNEVALRKIGTVGALGISDEIRLSLLLIATGVSAFLARKQLLNNNLENSSADPIDEAEIYLAYGRKKHAIKILEKGKLAYPERTDIRIKLDELRIKN
jgi:hypothetical protein